MKSKELREAEQIAAKYEPCVNIMDRHNKRVLVLHDDGSIFLYTSAVVVKWNNWYFVYAEHHDIGVFENEEVSIRYMTENYSIPNVNETILKLLQNSIPSLNDFKKEKIP